MVQKSHDFHLSHVHTHTHTHTHTYSTSADPLHPLRSSHLSHSATYINNFFNFELIFWPNFFESLFRMKYHRHQMFFPSCTISKNFTGEENIIKLCSIKIQSQKHVFLQTIMLTITESFCFSANLCFHCSD